MLAGQTNSATTLDLLPTSGDRPFYGVMVEQHDGPSWLRDNVDNDDVGDMMGIRPVKPYASKPIGMLSGWLIAPAVSCVATLHACFRKKGTV